MLLPRALKTQGGGGSCIEAKDEADAAFNKAKQAKKTVAQEMADLEVEAKALRRGAPRLRKLAWSPQQGT